MIDHAGTLSPPRLVRQSGLRYAPPGQVALSVGQAATGRATLPVLCKSMSRCRALNPTLAGQMQGLFSLTLVDFRFVKFDKLHQFCECRRAVERSVNKRVPRLGRLKLDYAVLELVPDHPLAAAPEEILVMSARINLKEG
jgi:hypothetical protein